MSSYSHLYFRARWLIKNLPTSKLKKDYNYEIIFLIIDPMPLKLCFREKVAVGYAKFFYGLLGRSSDPCKRSYIEASTT